MLNKKVTTLDFSNNTMVSGYKISQGISALIQGRCDMYTECYRSEHDTIPMTHYADSLMRKLRRDIQRLEAIKSHIEPIVDLPYEILKLLPNYCDSTTKYTGIVNKRSMDKAIGIANSRHTDPNPNYKVLPKNVRPIIKKLMEWCHKGIGVGTHTTQADNLGLRAMYTMLRDYQIPKEKVVNNHDFEDYIVEKPSYPLGYMKWTGELNTYIGQFKATTWSWAEFLLMLNIDLMNYVKDNPKVQKAIKQGKSRNQKIDRIATVIKDYSNHKCKWIDVVDVYNHVKDSLNRLLKTFLDKKIMDIIDTEIVTYDPKRWDFSDIKIELLRALHSLKA